VSEDDVPVPFSPPSITEADVAAVERVLRSGWLTTGEECLALEAELAAYLDVGHVVSMASGTAALEISYAALALPAGARLGVPTWTFVSTALAPHHHGARPVLLDVDPDTLNLSLDALDAALERGLDAVIAVHFGGVPIAKDIYERCASAGVPLIEDAAHALGATDHRGRALGRGSVGACLSLYATKNLVAGEGGALATDRQDVADFARSFRLHGMSADAWARYRPGSDSQYDLLGPGIKANLTDVLAALARSQLVRLDDLQARRRALVKRYRAALDAIDGMRFVPATLAENGSDHLVVVELPPGIERADVMATLASHQISTSVHFRPLHRFDWFARNAEIGPAGVANAEALADRVLSLPLSPALADDQVDRVCEVLREAITR
jgi:dTDP-4-amino-4,6-dideoxygalactose transaminase